MCNNCTNKKCPYEQRELLYYQIGNDLIIEMKQSLFCASLGVVYLYTLYFLGNFIIYVYVQLLYPADTIVLGSSYYLQNWRFGSIYYYYFFSLLPYSFYTYELSLHLLLTWLEGVFHFLTLHSCRIHFLFVAVSPYR